ncbi:MAG: hypothetical protein ACHQ1D_00450 [Nitrososphaerales archaeon]
MKSCPSFKADIYVGLRTGYSDNLHSVDSAKQLVRDYVNRVGLGVSFTETTFIYSEGEEPGLIIGLINYPRFPASDNEIEKRAMELGRILLTALSQERLSIVMSDYTIMLEKEDVR